VLQVGFGIADDCLIGGYGQPELAASQSGSKRISVG
jgi:hypothetical protein